MQNVDSPLITITNFCREFPQFAMDFQKRISEQPRVYDEEVLHRLPVELQPTHDYQAGGRGRANPNQTRTHSQCATCHRVLRNDSFFTPASMVARNVIYSHCKECSRQHNAQRFEESSALVQKRRHALWAYFVTQCSLCGFDQHISALDLHHPEDRESAVEDLITYLALAPDGPKAERLLREASRCVCLCSNCHRMLHSGAISLPSSPPHPAPYQLQDILRLVLDTS